MSRAQGARPRRILVGTLLALAACALLAPAAHAEYTQLFQKQITLASGSTPQPIGIDPEGDIIVFLEGQEVIAKFDQNGNPVNFSALGTNIIDGAGGLECATVPGDCDRVPAGQLGPFFLGIDPIAAVDSSGGPTNGYIYIRNHNRNLLTGEVAVFAPSGRFVGTLNEAQASPIATPDIPANSISVAPDGTIYTIRENQGVFGGAPGGGQADMYVPVDGNPAHDEFVGQVRLAFQYHVAEVNFPPKAVIGAGENGAFLRNNGAETADGRPLGAWRWWSVKDFQRPDEQYSLPSEYEPFARDGDNYAYQQGFVNGNNNWIYLIGGGSGIAIYGEDHQHKIGPTIATGGELGPDPETIAFDDTGGPNNGSFYVQGGEHSISVFGPPVVIPDINVEEAEAGHKSAIVHAEVALAGGPDVNECIVEYGLTKSYGSEVPCSPAPTYSSDQDVSAELPNLFTEADYHYRVKVRNSNGMNHTFDNVLRTVAVLKARTGDASNVGPNTATLEGSLNPDGMPTTYKFQYGLDKKQYDIETESQSAGSGTSDIAVSPIDIDKLQPGRTYHYRLVAENELGRTNAEDRTFTAPARPLISSLNPTSILGESVDLTGHINNFNLDSTYRFDYGTTAAYGQSTPEHELSAGTTPQFVVEHVTELQPGSTYHFRLVATNQFGTSYSTDATFDYAPPGCPNSHVRQQTGANYLPDCRAYELVSPARAGSIQFFPGDFFYRLETGIFGPELEPRYQNTGYESSPPRFGFYGGLGGLTGVESPNFLFDRYLATRTAQGWETHYAGLKGDETAVSLRGQCSLTQAKCIDYKANFSFETGLKADPFPYVWSADGKFLGRWPTNFKVVPEADHLTGDKEPSPDFSHFVFSSLDVPFKPGGLEVAPGSVYDNDVNRSTIEIVSRLENGEPIPQDAGPASEYIRIPAISNDGSHILMSTEASGGRVDLYMRVNDAITYEITKGSGVELLGMNSDGSKVAFISSYALTSEDTDSSTDIYMWEQSTDEVKLISVGAGEGESDNCFANWTEKCDVQLLHTERPDVDDRMSASGDVYFLSPEQLDSENPGVRNQKNIYHIRNGHVQYVTTLEPGTTTLRSQISSDGQYAAFLTKSQLTGYDNQYYDNFGNLKRAAEMYVFDAATGEVECASCNPTGEPPHILRLDPPANEENYKSADVMASNSGRFMSDDGRVAFATADALSPRDTDGIVDVYEYTGGRPQLIGAGTGDRDILPKLALLYPGQVVGLESMSRDGRDLYFSTYDTLVPQDQNGPFVKFYDARVAGGFPVQGELLPCEAADECHGETSNPASDPKVGTGTEFTAPGNVTIGPRKSAKQNGKRNRTQHRKKHRHRRRHAIQRRAGR